MDSRPDGGGSPSNVQGNAAARPSARFDAPTRAPNAGSSKIQQPKPQALPSRKAQSSILVSTRQKGNPVVDNIRAMPWEYADIPADFVLGQTACALFLSLKYHRLHPEYIYSRIRGLQGKYNLRIVLTVVDITNHEEPLRELTKTSIVNHVTVILCWSATEAARYLELFKSFEGTAPTGIKAHQSNSYAERLIDFITVPRGINKTDAGTMMSTFGSLKTAINAQPEEIGTILGWGDTKVKRWCSTVREPFRTRKAAKRGISHSDSRPSMSREPSAKEQQSGPNQNARSGNSSVAKDSLPQVATQRGSELDLVEDDDEQTPQDASSSSKTKPDTLERPSAKRPKTREFEPSEGVAAALAKLRGGGGG